MSIDNIARNIDLSNFAPGSEIPLKDCEKLLGMRSTDRNYQFSLMQLTDAIDRRLRRIGVEITLRTLQGRIVALTDSEAAEFNPKKYKRLRSRMARSHRKLMAVDTSKLTKDEQACLERNIYKQSVQLSFLRKRVDMSELVAPVKRDVPSMKR